MNETNISWQERSNASESYEKSTTIKKPDELILRDNYAHNLHISLEVWLESNVEN